MLSLALTGGTATGKSTFCRLLQEVLPSAVVFDCDAAVHRLLQDEEVGARIVEAFGEAVAEEGRLSRSKLRDLAFQDPDRRRELEGLLHPLVRKECLELKAKTDTDGASPVFVADVPLLFESGFDFGYERALVVATTRETQLARLQSRNGFDDTLAEAILAAQLPIGEKIARADVVFWNEGPEEVLRNQITRFLHTHHLMSDDDKAKKSRGKADETEIEIKTEIDPAVEAGKVERKAKPKTKTKTKTKRKSAAKRPSKKAEEEIVELGDGEDQKQAEEKQAEEKKPRSRKARNPGQEKEKEEKQEQGQGQAKEKELEKEPESQTETDSDREGESKQKPEAQPKPEPKPEPIKYEVPEMIDVNEFRERPLAELLKIASKYPLRPDVSMGKGGLVFDLLAFYSTHGSVLEAEGILEQAKENYAMLRDPKRSFRTSPDDFYIGGNLLKQHGLRVGQLVKVKLRAPRERDKYLSALEVLTIEGMPAADFEAPKSFDQLTSLFPEDRFVLERAGPDALAVRLIDLVAPIGKGQRGIIVAPPRGGKTILLKEIAKSIRANHPETELIILLLDERPEEVTDFEEAVDAPVYASTFDEPSKRHAQVSDLVLERARRLVELGKDVVILLDSLTRLARGYNNAQRGGPIGSGGLSPSALQQSRKFFGAARNVEEGGSLTIVATCLVETESRMDDIIFEELKGTGNMEIILDRELAERRVYPAIHIPQSGTRNDDRLYHPEEMAKVIEIRRALSTLPIGEALETLLKQLSKNSTNAELLMRGMI